MKKTCYDITTDIHVSPQLADHPSRPRLRVVKRRSGAKGAEDAL